MRDLSTQELGFVYGAGTSCSPTPPSKSNKGKNTGGKGTMKYGKGTGTRGTGTRGKGTGTNCYC